MEKKIKIIGICGSLRKGSYNRMALNFAKKIAPPTVDFQIVEIKNLPFFNQDLENNLPKEVLEFREKIKKADAILFSSPEYNYSIPGVLKNAIEWGSRPYEAGVLKRKPVAIMGTSSGMVGTGRGQYHFRQICVQVDMYVLNRPEVMIPFASQQFDEKGNLLDPHTKEKIKEIVEALVLWAKKMN